MVDWRRRMTVDGVAASKPNINGDLNHRATEVAEVAQRKTIRVIEYHPISACSHSFFSALKETKG
jgi:predicted nuclease with RNAse H fold